MAKKIAITFDDAPMYGGPLLTGADRTQTLLEALSSVGATATFFATTRDLEVAGALARLTDYNDAGHLIANHTDTHAGASATNINVFLDDIAAANDVISGFSNYRPWFRFPYLDEGNSPFARDAYRDGLESLGMENGYVTVDTFDWYMVDRLSAAIDSGEVYNLDAIRDAYVDMIVTAANHYDALGLATLGRSPAQVLLLHENDLAAMFIDDAILALEADGWEIVSADEAYQDPIADIEPQTLQSGSGRLAAIALDDGAPFSVLEHEGNSTAGIDATLAEYGAFGVDPSDNQIIGTTGNDNLAGTTGDDEFVGDTGNDVFNESTGSDVIFGELEGSTSAGDYDQVDYDGHLSDYTFTKNTDGSVSVLKPNGDTDTLYSIEGFWFSQEGAWYSIDQVLPNDGTIVGTAGNDYLIGSAGDDTISGLAGNDTISESAGNDVIDGGGNEYDQVDYQGSLSDYVFQLNTDGTVAVTKPSGGADTLSNIDGFWFDTEQAWYNMDQALASSADGAIVTGTAGDDILSGTGGDDTISGLGGVDVINASAGNDVIDGGGSEYDQVDYAGAKSDYIFTQNANGTVSVQNLDGDVDTLSNIDGFWFQGEGAWYGINQVIGAAAPQAASVDAPETMVAPTEDFIFQI